MMGTSSTGIHKEKMQNKLVSTKIHGCLAIKYFEKAIFFTKKKKIYRMQFHPPIHWSTWQASIAHPFPLLQIDRTKKEKRLGKKNLAYLEFSKCTEPLKNLLHRRAEHLQRKTKKIKRLIRPYHNHSQEPAARLETSFLKNRPNQSIGSRSNGNKANQIKNQKRTATARIDQGTRDVQKKEQISD